MFASASFRVDAAKLKDVQPAAVSTFASRFVEWARERAGQVWDKGISVSAVVEEDLALTVATGKAQGRVIEQQVVDATRSTLCAATTRCDVSVPGSVGANATGRRLSVAVQDQHLNHSFSGTPPLAPLPRPPPLPPPYVPALPYSMQQSPLPSPPELSNPSTVGENITVSVRRARYAKDISSSALGDGTLARASSAFEQLNVSLVCGMLTALTAEVILFLTADNSSVADSVAPALFNVLQGAQGLNLSESINLPDDALRTVARQVQFVHGELGLVVINFTWSPSDASPPGNESSSLIGSDMLVEQPPEALMIAPQGVQTAAALVNTAVMATVIITVASSVTASIASSVSTSIASSAAGTVGSGTGAAGAMVSGVMPLVLGGQRFVSYSAADGAGDSSFSMVGDSMAWIQGDFGLYMLSSATPSAERRLSGEADDVLTDAAQDVSSQTSWSRLLSVIAIALAALAATMAFHAFMVYRWRHRANKLFYEVKRNPKAVLSRVKSRRATSRGSAVDQRLPTTRQRLIAVAGRLRVVRAARGVKSMHSSKGKQDHQENASNEPSLTRLAVIERKQIAEEISRIRFRPFPSPLVFPGIQILAIQIFCSGILGNAIKVVTGSGGCTEAGCRVFAAFCIAFVVAYEVLTASLVIHFHRHFRAACWHAVPRPTDATKVSDPLFRLLSKMAHLILPKQGPFAFTAIDRPRGLFKAPKEWKQEPRRTERLLAAPRVWEKSNASDTLDGIGFALMARAGGDSLAASMFEMAVFGSSLCIAALNSIRSDLVAGSAGATGTIIAVLCVQVAMVFYVVAYRPSADRVINILVFSQFFLEGAGSAIFLFQAISPEQSSGAASARFTMCLLAMFAPVIQRFYDAIIVQSFKVLRGGFTWKGFFFSMMGFVVFLPTMIIRLSSCDCGAQVAMSASQMAGDDLNKLATKMANEGLVASIEEGTAELASRAFWQVHVEAEFRRDRQEELAEAAARLVQARWRARRAAHAPHDKLPDAKPAGHVQCAASPSQKRGIHAGGRPGFQWVESIIDVTVTEEVEVDVQEQRPATAVGSTPTESAIRRRSDPPVQQWLAAKWDPRKRAWVAPLNSQEPPHGARAEAATPVADHVSRGITFQNSRV